MALIEAGQEDAARARFAEGFDTIYPHLRGHGSLEQTAFFFFELDEYLNNATARDLGMVSLDLVRSSYSNLLDEHDTERRQAP
ncbi:hypothetical protein [Sphingomonas sp.]|uniref:hypothetical protein n=1 Tax=Sphingomonas sp. TaxID=28214 RepID=UPI003F6EE37B